MLGTDLVLLEYTPFLSVGRLCSFFVVAPLDCIACLVSKSASLVGGLMSLKLISVSQNSVGWYAT